MIPLNLVLSSVMILTSLFSAVLALYALSRRRAEKSALPFFFLLSFSAIYIFAASVTIRRADVAGIFRSICVEYLGIAFIPACFVWLAACFSPTRKGFPWLVPIAFAASCATLIGVWTNDFHHLFYTSIALDTSGPFPTARLSYGPWARCNNGYYIFGMLLAIAQYARHAIHTGGIDRSRMVLLCVPFSLGILEQIIVLFGLFPWNLDIGPFFLLPVNGLTAYAILRRDLFDVSSLARKNVFNAMDEGVLVILPNREIIDWNPAVFRYFPDAERNLSGRRLDAVSADLASLCETLPLGSSGELALGSIPSARYVSVDAVSISGKSQRRAGAALILRDITATKNHIALLEELAIRDGLTGCYNRRHWITLAETEFVRAKRTERSMAIIMIDIDHFKDVNDTWGHAMGDAVLKSVTDSLSGVLRATDTLGRVGGEEFAIILPETDLDTAELIAERLRAVVEEGNALRESGEIPIPIPITISLGATAISLIDLSLSAMLHRADGALYRAKGNGRNRVEAI